MKLYAAIQKRDDEQRMVWGYASTEALDAQGEVVKLDAMKGAWDDYMKFANIREMHQPSAVGKCKEYEFDDKGVMIGVKVVDDAAWKKVVEGVYGGFSIGGKSLSKSAGTITALRLTEISLVDRPANPEAVISMFKGEEIGDTEAAQGASTDGGGMGDGVTKGEGGNNDSGDSGEHDEALMAVKKYAGEQIADAAAAIAALDAINYLLWKESSEQGEPPEQVTALQAAVAAIKQFIASEIMEPDHKSEDPDDLTKAGARFSKSTKAALKAAHDACKAADTALSALKYEAGEDAEEDEGEDAGKADSEADIAKVADLESQIAGLNAAQAEIAKALGMGEGDKFLDAIAKLHSRIAELEAMPEPARAARTGSPVSKADDGRQSDQSAIEIELEAATDPAQLASLVMKHIHQTGARKIAG